MNLGEEILAYNDHKVEQVLVPEWGEHGTKVYVRSLGQWEYDQYEYETNELRKGGEVRDGLNMGARFVQLVACTKDGKPLFDKVQAKRLGAKSLRAMKRLMIAGAQLNGLAADDVEELVKNFDATASDDSSSP